VNQRSKKISQVRQKLIDVGRLQNERERELFDTLAEHAPEMLAQLFGAALADIVTTEEDSTDRE